MKQQKKDGMSLFSLALFVISVCGITGGAIYQYKHHIIVSNYLYPLSIYQTLVQFDKYFHELHWNILKNVKQHFLL